MSRPGTFFSQKVERKENVVFPLGAELRRSGRIVPVFLPFLGCPGRCVFCAQDAQTGSTGRFSLHAVLEEASRVLEEAHAVGERCELAFYGGTFTALPARERQACLDFLDREKALGHVDCARCSTRPDALDPDVLDELAQHGIDLVELGIQSFCDEALALSRRGYSAETALSACRKLSERGFLFGVQLLPGMPGSTPEVFLRDVETAAGLGPACMRFYPCLVPEGTELARWYRQGIYEPWSVAQTAEVLGRALALAWQSGIPVIRLAVAPEGAFDSALAAGPRHPAMGGLVQAEALWHTVAAAAERLGRQPERLALPRRCQGFAFGERGMLKERWKGMGLLPGGIVFEDRADGELS